MHGPFSKILGGPGPPAPGSTPLAESTVSSLQNAAAQSRALEGLTMRRQLH